jgi:hypothetical protein
LRSVKLLEGIENKFKLKEEKQIKALQDKLKSKKIRTESPFVRVHGIESHRSKAETDSKKQGEDGKDQPASRIPSSRLSENPKKSIKKWDSHGEGGGVKMNSTR